MLTYVFYLFRRWKSGSRTGALKRGNRWRRGKNWCTRRNWRLWAQRTYNTRISKWPRRLLRQQPWAPLRPRTASSCDTRNLQLKHTRILGSHLSSHRNLRQSYFCDTFTRRWCDAISQTRDNKLLWLPSSLWRRVSYTHYLWTSANL